MPRCLQENIFLHAYFFSSVYLWIYFVAGLGWVFLPFIGCWDVSLSPRSIPTSIFSWSFILSHFLTAAQNKSPDILCAFQTDSLNRWYCFKIQCVQSSCEMGSVLQNQRAIKFQFFPGGDYVEVLWMPEYIKKYQQPLEGSSPLNQDVTN